jgi:hypothetical protein
LLAIDVAEAERILLQAIQINRNLFQNAYVAPYSLFFYHLYGQENKIAALLPAMLTSDVIKQYHYVVNLDRCLNDRKFPEKKNHFSRNFFVLSQLTTKSKYFCPIS